MIPATDVERARAVRIEDEISIAHRGDVDRPGASGPCPLCEHCSICGCAPCGTPGFCQMCCEVDRKPVAQRRRQHDLPPNWDTMSVGALWDWLNDPRRYAPPKSVVDAFHYLIKQNDPERLRAWLSRRTPNERRALRKLIEQ
jgi:hypothetical protein